MGFPCVGLVGHLRPGHARARTCRLRRDVRHARPRPAQGARAELGRGLPARASIQGTALKPQGAPIDNLYRARRHDRRAAAAPARPAAPSSTSRTWSRTPARGRAGRPHRELRAGLPHADGRAGGARHRPASRQHIQKLYGLDNPKCTHFAKQCLIARRLVERGVRFVQIYSGGMENERSWDGHTEHRRQPHAASPARPTARSPACSTDLEAARAARLDAGDLGRRVRPAADRAEGRHRPRPQPARLHHLAGRRRREGRRRTTARPTRSATRRSRTASASTTCTPRSCTCWASTTTKLTYRYNGRDFRLTDVAGNVVKEVVNILTQRPVLKFCFFTVFTVGELQCCSSRLAYQHFPSTSAR